MHHEITLTVFSGDEFSLVNLQENYVRNPRMRESREEYQQLLTYMLLSLKAQISLNMFDNACAIAVISYQ